MRTMNHTHARDACSSAVAHTHTHTHAKETVFKALLQSDFFNSGAAILLTGRGQPDEGTKHLASRYIVS